MELLMGKVTITRSTITRMLNRSYMTLSSTFSTSRAYYRQDRGTRVFVPRYTVMDSIIVRICAEVILRSISCRL